MDRDRSRAASFGGAAALGQLDAGSDRAPRRASTLMLNFKSIFLSRGVSLICHQRSAWKLALLPSSSNCKDLKSRPLPFEGEAWEASKSSHSGAQKAGPGIIVIISRLSGSLELCLRSIVYMYMDPLVCPVSHICAGNGALPALRTLSGSPSNVAHGTEA